jgi:hypothetical protein
MTRPPPVRRPEMGSGMSEALTFEDFAARHGASRQLYGDAGLHNPAAHMPRSTWKRLVEKQAAADSALQARRDALYREYVAAEERGEIRPPSRRERLEACAAGNPDREDVQACRRLLAKLPTNSDAA